MNSRKCIYPFSLFLHVGYLQFLQTVCGPEDECQHRFTIFEVIFTVRLCVMPFNELLATSLLLKDYVKISASALLGKALQGPSCLSPVCLQIYIFLSPALFCMSEGCSLPLLFFMFASG